MDFEFVNKGVENESYGNCDDIVLLFINYVIIVIRFSGN